MCIRDRCGSSACLYEVSCASSTTTSFRFSTGAKTADLAPTTTLASPLSTRRYSRRRSPGGKPLCSIQRSHRTYDETGSLPVPIGLSPVPARLRSHRGPAPPLRQSEIELGLAAARHPPEYLSFGLSRIQCTIQSFECGHLLSSQPVLQLRSGCHGGIRSGRILQADPAVSGRGSPGQGSLPADEQALLQQRLFPPLHDYRDELVALRENGARIERVLVWVSRKSSLPPWTASPRRPSPTALPPM